MNDKSGVIDKGVLVLVILVLVALYFAHDQDRIPPSQARQEGDRPLVLRVDGISPGDRFSRVQELDPTFKLQERNASRQHWANKTGTSVFVHDGNVYAVSGSEIVVGEWRLDSRSSRAEVSRLGSLWSSLLLDRRVGLLHTSSEAGNRFYVEDASLGLEWVTVGLRLSR